MHALHSLAHRAPPATRTRVRWQPYSSIPSSSSSSSASSRSSPASYLNTPASSVSSSPQVISRSHQTNLIRPSTSSSTISKDTPIKDPSRNKYITSLVDQTVKSLSEIWRPQDIPSVFVASAHSMVMGSGTYEASLVIDPKPTPAPQFQKSHLPSPISPSTTPSPHLCESPSPLANTASASTTNSRGNLVPIKSFVHEVLRRSRTSGCVLQTALCYLEAIRSKVPELVRAEQAGEGVQGEEDRSDWIVPATAEEIEREAQLITTADTNDQSAINNDDSLVATVRVDDVNTEDSPYQRSDSASSAVNSTPPPRQMLSPGPPLPPLPPLPSPLLCPRRAFLASLILASKFTQDKCYSNRAWAKLSGLPPREIGRCERALGDALDWRLWVGKQPSTSAAPPSPNLSMVSNVTRPLVRSQSESCLVPTTQGPFLLPEDKIVTPTSVGICENRSLRRHSTLPVDAFTTATTVTCPVQAPLGQVPWRSSMHLSQCHKDDRSDDMDCSDQLTPTEPFLVMGDDIGRSVSGYCNFSKIHQSPSPQTPGLTYSPSSTESCSGDRTIQMTSFLDDPMGSFNPNQSNGSEYWPWLDSSEGIQQSNMVTPVPTTWHSHKANISPPNGPFDVAPSGANFNGPLPFKLADIDSGISLYPWVPASDNATATAYPAHW